MMPLKTTVFAAVFAVAATQAAASGAFPGQATAEPTAITAFSSIGPAAEAEHPDAGPGYALSVYETMEDASEPPLDQPFCDTHAEMGLILTEEFGETFVGSAIEKGGLKTEVWASAGAGTWTLLHSDDSGISCVISSGFGWTAEGDIETILHAAGLQPVSTTGQLIAGAELR